VVLAIEERLIIPPQTSLDDMTNSSSLGVYPPSDFENQVGRLLPFEEQHFTNGEIVRRFMFTASIKTFTIRRSPNV
jgi:hypothetical protein